MSAVEALRRRGTPDAVALLTEAVHLPVDPLLGPTAIAALEHIVAHSRAGYPDALRALLRLGTEPEWRSAAIESLARLPRHVATDHLSQAMRDADVASRLVIVEALARFRCPEASALLVASLADTDPGVRGAAVTALGRTGSLAAADALTRLQHADPDPTVRRRAVRICQRYGWRATSPEFEV